MKEEIRREEWDFSSCPLEEMTQCEWYEYTRRIKSIRNHVIAVRKAYKINNKRTFDKLYESIGKIIKSAPFTLIQAWYCWPEFPQFPYLSIPFKERNRRFEKIFNITRPAKEIFARSLEAYSLTPHYLMNYFYRACENTKRPIHESGGTNVMFCINWDYHDDNLVKKFKAWLEDNRKGRQPIIECRGNGTAPIQSIKKLKQLGAWQLLKHYNGDWAKSYDHLIEKDLKKHFKKGEPLYQNQPRWSTAQKEADKNLRQIEEAFKKVCEMCVEHDLKGKEIALIR